MIALIAHDHKKDELVELIQEFRDVLSKYELCATGTTGQRIIDETGLAVGRFLSGPQGGDAQIAAQAAEGHIEAILFIVDPLFSHPHEPDVQGLVRVCNVHNVAIALNLATARIILRGLAGPGV